MGRAPCCEKVGLRRGRWTTEEDEKLINYIHQHGEGSWRSLPKNAGLLRCGKSCRLRWINYLRTDLKRGNITPQEEETIIRLHSIMGNRWSLIAGQLSGRTDNEIKNYWNSHLSRKIHTFIRPNGDPNGGKIIINMTHASAPPKRRGGRTSRAEMQRNRANNNANNNKNNEASSTQGKNVNNSNRLKNGNHQNDSVLDDNKTGPLDSTHEKSDLNDLIGPQGEGSELLDIEDLMGLDGVDPQWYSNNNTINSDGPNIAFDMGPVSSTGTGVLSTAGSSTASSSYVDHHDHDNQQRSMVDWEWDWDWEIGTVDHVGKEYQQVWNDKEQIISWLWENDDENSLENFNFNYLNDNYNNNNNNNNNDCNNVDLSTLPDVVDSDKEQAMVAWLLS